MVRGLQYQAKNSCEVFMSSSVSATSGVASASDIQTMYLKLLSAQMQNQNPLDPMSDDQMASQMAQFSQLQQLESMSSGINQMVTSTNSLNSNFAKVLAGTQMDYGKNLVGKVVAYTDSNGSIQMGTVNQVEVQNGTPSLRIGDTSVSLDSVVAVGDETQVKIPNQLSYGQSLINRTVAYVNPSTGQTQTGVVQNATLSNNNVYLLINGQEVGLDQVGAVGN
jgi:flagellar basal-body rod modification protein FlgD